MAAEQGHTDAQYNFILLRLLSGIKGSKQAQKDYANAWRWLYKAADKGDAVAQRNLGCLYFMGIGISKDYAEAKRLFTLAAEQGDHPANFNLLYSDINVEAEGQLRNAADKGDPGAQFTLGLMYAKGVHPVYQDYGKAIGWLTKAAIQGHENAQIELGALYTEPLGVPKEASGARIKQWCNGMSQEEKEGVSMRMDKNIVERMTEATL